MKWFFLIGIIVLGVVILGCEESTQTYVPPAQPAVAKTYEIKETTKQEIETKDATNNNPLQDVKYWAYLIQDQNLNGNIQKLADSQYDLVVIDNMRTVVGDEDHDNKGDVALLKSTTGYGGKQKIVIGYIDIGEAEEYRYYWQDGWSIGNPTWIVHEDPDGWADNYPVAYWNSEWKTIVYDFIDTFIDDGYDGIYMDWIEGFSDEAIVDAADDDGVDARKEMIKFIGEISRYAKGRQPGFFVIAQNAVELGTDSTYLGYIDAVAQEQIWFDGEADADKGSAAEGDYAMPATGDYSSKYYNDYLTYFAAAGLPIFSVDYAQDKKNVDKAYSEALNLGYKPYVSIRSLSRLTNDPPPGYPG